MGIWGKKGSKKKKGCFVTQIIESTNKEPDRGTGLAVHSGISHFPEPGPGRGSGQCSQGWRRQCPLCVSTLSEAGVHLEGQASAFEELLFLKTAKRRCPESSQDPGLEAWSKLTVCVLCPYPRGQGEDGGGVFLTHGVPLAQGRTQCMGPSTVKTCQASGSFLPGAGDHFMSQTIGGRE